MIAHLLQNADRHRVPDTPITLRLQADETRVTIEVHNAGEAIDEALLGRIFEYGVSGATEAEPGTSPFPTGAASEDRA